MTKYREYGEQETTAHAECAYEMYLVHYEDLTSGKEERKQGRQTKKVEQGGYTNQRTRTN